MTTATYLLQETRAIVLERAGHKCERCGGTGPQGLVLVHHKFPFRVTNYALTSLNLFNHPSNLEALCPSCHAKVHGNGRPDIGEWNKRKWGKA